MFSVGDICWLGSSPLRTGGYQTGLTPRHRTCFSFSHRTSRWISTSVNSGRTRGSRSGRGLVSRPCPWDPSSSRTSGCQTPSSWTRSSLISTSRPRATSSYAYITPAVSPGAYGEPCPYSDANLSPSWLAILKPLTNWLCLSRMKLTLYSRVYQPL